MMSSAVLFHLAFPVADIPTAKAFYVGGLGCEPGRETSASLILNLYGRMVADARLDGKMDVDGKVGVNVDMGGPISINVQGPIVHYVGTYISKEQMDLIELNKTRGDGVRMLAFMRWIHFRGRPVSSRW